LTKAVVAAYTQHITDELAGKLRFNSGKKASKQQHVRMILHLQLASHFAGLWYSSDS
jgi:hypothetical protein